MALKSLPCHVNTVNLRNSYKSNFSRIAVPQLGGQQFLTGSHGNNLYYLKSNNANSISSWTIANAAWNYGYNGAGLHCYVSLVCDANDTLHMVDRQVRNDICSSEPMYMLCYSRKLKEGVWERAKPLVVPPYCYYSCYYHQLSLDHNGNLYLSYSYWGIHDDYNFLLNNLMCTYRSVLCSKDGGASWDLVHNGDF